jgi:hypothetical protein
MNGHPLQLHFCMFERSQGKHNSLDCHKKIWNIFHEFQSLHVQSLIQINLFFYIFKAFKLNNPCFFSNILFFYQMYSIPFGNWRGFSHWGKRI